MPFIPNTANRPVHWIKYDDTDIDTLLAERQEIDFYREIGGRRIIQTDNHSSKTA